MRSTNSANLMWLIDDTNFQNIIPKKVPGNAYEAALKFENSIIDNDTG